MQEVKDIEAEKPYLTLLYLKGYKELVSPRHVIFIPYKEGQRLGIYYASGRVKHIAGNDTNHLISRKLF